MAPEDELQDWLSTKEVADHFGVAAKQVVIMIRKGRIPACKVGWTWMVHREWLPASWPPPMNRISA